jgi:acyl dehydratase
MTKRILPNRRDLRQLIGKEVAVSPWVRVTQQRIAHFAEASGDHQWIHVDEKRARVESPFGTTIAHGFLTLSLLSHLLDASISLPEYSLGINYGCNRVRFVSPVPAGSNVRARFVLAALVSFAATGDLGPGDQFTWNVTIERQDFERPVLVAEWLTRRYR